MYQSTSYIIAIDAKKTLPNGMYICSDVPHFSFRTAKFNGKRILLIGGFEHKTGLHISYKDSYGALENEAKSLYPECEVLYNSRALRVRFYISGALKIVFLWTRFLILEAIHQLYLMFLWALVLKNGG